VPAAVCCWKCMAVSCSCRSVAQPPRYTVKPRSDSNQLPRADKHAIYTGSGAGQLTLGPILGLLLHHSAAF
jgi:hypothetical protein